MPAFGVAGLVLDLLSHSAVVRFNMVEGMESVLGVCFCPDNPLANITSPLAHAMFLAAFLGLALKGVRSR